MQGVNGMEIMVLVQTPFINQSIFEELQSNYVHGTLEVYVYCQSIEHL